MSLIKGRRLNPFKILRLIIVLVAIPLSIMAISSFFGGDSCDPTPLSESQSEAIAEAEIVEAKPSVAPPAKSRLQQLSDILEPIDQPLKYQPGFDSMPPGGIKMRINYLGGTLGRVFNDSNHLHIEAAQRIGVTPVNHPDDVWKIDRPLIKVESCPEFYVDQLRHSLPFLVPEAHRLLTDIGSAFRDSLQSRGGGDYRIKVTSVFRTNGSIKALKRRNVNAVSQSTHLNATTFDISYSKFICDDPALPRTQEDLKNLLGEVLNDMRNQGRCLVKYERRQACYHITATGF